MKYCPKCNEKHGNKGLFCSRKCSNSRTFTRETKEIKRIKARTYYSSLPEELQQKRKEALLQGLQNRIMKASLNKEWKLNSSNITYKNILIKEQNHKCLICNITDTWNNLPLKLHLDHIDGNNKNNIRSNLRLICPNCHSQTSTYCGRNNKKVLTKRNGSSA